MSEIDDLVDALAPVVAAFEQLEIPHYVGGSVASSFHGATRSTADVDLVCGMRAEKITPFVSLIEADFYASNSAIKQAVRQKSCFNLIHLPTSFKVDCFVTRERPFDILSMQRASFQVLGESRQLEVRIASVEDAIVSKLEWYRLTNETSERQWNDVSRLIELLGDTLDSEYLHQAAQSIGVEDLLRRLLDQ